MPSERSGSARVRSVRHEEDDELSYPAGQSRERAHDLRRHAAVPAHIDHGDFLGTCSCGGEGSGGGGGGTGTDGGGTGDGGGGGLY